MNVDRLEQLGLNISGSEQEPQATAELLLPLINPLTRSFIDRVTFTVREGRLWPHSPPELVGLAPLAVAGVERFADLEAQLHTAYDDAILHMQRRSAELQALGFEPQVDPSSLQLTSTIAAHDVEIRVGADKQGQFRVLQALRKGERLPLPPDLRFELSEFREGTALSAYLEELVTDAASPARASAVRPAAEGAPAKTQVMVKALTLGDLFEQFGAEAVVPQKTPVEVVVDLRVGDEKFRFAASRVAGRTFRGLLAGPRGKVWADRFELEEFPGVRTLVASELNVPQEQVELVGLDIPPDARRG